MRRIITQTGAATALCVALAVPAGGTVHTAARPDPGTDGKTGVRAVLGTVDRLFRDAAAATERYEAARRASAAQRVKIAELQRAVRAQHRRLVVLRGRIGQLAARQYQSGGLGPTAELLTSRSPEDLLDKVFLLDKGEQAAAGLYHRAERAERRLAAERERQAVALADLRAELRTQARVKRLIETKLARAQRRLERLQSGQTARSRGSDCPRAERSRSVTLSTDGKALGGRKWTAPVGRYTLSARFAQDGGMWSSRHTGLDFAVPEGRPVGSVGYGLVYEIGCDDAFGNSVTVLHDDGYYTFYAHLSEVRAKPGARVFPGQPLGRAGTTGNSTGPHLHFEVRVTPQFGSGIDPEPWLRDKGVRLRKGPAE
ncbi:peptidoglycan DD-metalloendopeptidase family protein [Streptomyces sp. WMMC500]|uniref:murein hydrolase activator EnvC family protein n=1 Tax=Streptomyces sp. WMMC500 TaxID=3015154 RepID=UPI00248B1397|nr:peptidoglycan DD-metalloendopeptidase family protein [Streptomyces sp. WMMC500]WBB59552.1 peptidoglycan DD-metalloendopeptidase family protein [Streptomyces sp. WMMC500]